MKTYNKFWSYKESSVDSLEQLKSAELKFYEENFTDLLNQQNTAHKAARHYKRVKTMDQFITARYTKPEECILRFNKEGKASDIEVLWLCALEYLRRMTGLYKDNLNIITMALCKDNEGFYILTKRVWTAKGGLHGICISQNQALYDMGFRRPIEDAPETKYNNAKQSFTEFEQGLWESICKDKGFDINKDKEPKPSGRKSLLKRQEADRFKTDFRDMLYDEIRGDVYDDEIEYMKTKPINAQFDYCLETLGHETAYYLKSSLDFDEKVDQSRQTQEETGRIETLDGLLAFITNNGLKDKYEAFKRMKKAK